MKKFTVLLFVLLLTTSVKAQHEIKFYLTNFPRILNNSNEPIANAFTGGFHNPQFSSIDLNNDSIQDLFVFDRIDGKVLTFINRGNPNVPDYEYAPEYESSFPRLRRTALLVDYNHDGKPDIFAYSSEWGAAIEVWKNISTKDSIKFELVTSELRYKGFFNIIFLSNIDIPAITDIDGDGDIDILTFENLYTTVRFYKNLAVDSGYSSDSLVYDLCDLCWGQFFETGNYIIDNVEINANQFPCIPQTRKKKKKHYGGTLFAYDDDGDGDQDLAMGDASNSDIIKLINGRVENSYPVDSMISWNRIFPDSKIDLPNLPAVFKADVNGDGVYDIILSPQAEDTLVNKNQIWYYQNMGTNSDPDFKFVQKDFLQDNTVDFGSYTAPAFLDYDGDGDMDMFIATHGNFSVTGNKADRLVLYENTPINDTPYFKKVNDDYLNLSKDGIMMMAPAFGDIDGDGDKDLLIGQLNGKLIYYENNPSNGKASFSKVTDNFQNIDIGDQSRPAIADVNGDSLQDLVIGKMDGTISYYKNTSAGPLSFVLVNDTFGNIYLNKRYDIYPTAPAISDLDGNGVLDLVVGGDSGLNIYPDFTKNLSGTFTRLDTVIFDENIKKGSEKYLGLQLMPAIAKLDQDTLPDIMLGNKRGGIIYLGSFDQLRDSIPHQVHAPEPYYPNNQVFIYPNPSSDFLTVEVLGHRANIDISVISITGKILLEKPYILNEKLITRLDLRTLKQGLYLVMVRDKNTGKVITKKINHIK